MRLQGLTLLLVFFRYISSTLFFSFTPFKYIYHSFNLWHLLCLNWKTCVKHCSQAERDQVFEELRPHFLNLAYSAYAVHLVKKMLDNGNGLLEICACVYDIMCVCVISVALYSNWISPIFSLEETTGRLYLYSSWPCCSSSSPHGWISWYVT